MILKNERDVVMTFIRSYPHIQKNDAEKIYAQAVGAYIDLAFPFDQSIYCIPKNRPRAYQWVYDCMCEILEREGCTSMTGYSENGLSMSWDNSQISNGLRMRIVPKVGAVK